MPSRALDDFLELLPSTGPSGFEGLIARLLEAETGQRFRIASSGQQYGLDVASEYGSGNSIKVEAKHYKKSTLDLRELTAELTQVATLPGTPLDLWIVAASCPVSQQHEDSLTELAHERDVEILILDRGNDGLERLLVLMAAQISAVLNFITEHGYPADKRGIQTTLSELTANPSFDLSRQQLRRKLSGTLLGYEDARRRAKTNLIQSLNDSRTTEAVFNQKIRVWPYHSGAIHRPTLEKRLDVWWKETAPDGYHLALLGEEGIGKTWGVIAWMLKALHANRLPITLPFSCSTQALQPGTTIEDLLPDLLETWTSVGDRDVWSRRLSRWLEDSTTVGPLVLIVAEGLNECAGFNWPNFFRPLLHQRLRGRILVVATDRQGHWYPNCRQLELNSDRFRTLVVPGYDDQELQDALAGKGIAPSQIPSGLQGLIRTPRYCDLVAEHFEEMENSNDFTRERLILLDIRHRQDQKRASPLSEDDFIEIIRKLAQHFRQKSELATDDVRSLVPDPDRSRQIYQEIIDGGFLTQEQVGARRYYKVERTRLIFGLGMLLADDMRKEASTLDSASIGEKISQWLGAQADMDLKVETAASAMFHALLDDDYPATARRELIRHWLSARNRSSDDGEPRLAYVLRAPADFIAITETFWSSAPNRGGAQLFLARAYSRYGSDSRLTTLLTDAIQRWMGFIHPAGPPLLRPTPDEEKKQRSQIKLRVGRELAPGPLEILAERLTVIEDAGLLRLSRFAFLLFSSGRVTNLAQSLATWSVASAVMGHAMERDVAKWAVRFSEDALDELVPRARRLLESGSEIGLSAGHILLDVLGTEPASNLAREFPEPESEQTRQWRLRHEADPCLSVFAWSREECERCLQRTDVPLHIIFSHARDRLIDPNKTVPASLITRAVTALGEINPSKIHEGFFYSQELHSFDELAPFIAAHSPEELANYVRAVARSMPGRDLKSRRQLAFWMDEIYPVLKETELSGLRAVIDEFRSADWPEISSSMRTCLEQEAEGFAMCGLLPHLVPDDRFREVMKRSVNALQPGAVFEWLEPISSTLFEEAFASIRPGADEAFLIHSLLWLAMVRPPESNVDRDCLVAIAHNRNSMLRATVMRFACLSNDVELGRRLVDIGAKYIEPENLDETYWGTRLLKQYGSNCDFDTLYGRVNQAAASHILEARGCINTEVASYAHGLDACWRKIIESPEPAPGELAKILINEGDEYLGVELPKFDDADSGSIRFQDASTSWTSEQTGSVLETFRKWGEGLDTQRLKQKSQDRRDTVINAWRTTVLALYGRRFSKKALAAVYQEAPNMVRNWVEAVKRGDSRRDLACSRLGSLYLDLCHTVFTVDPPLAFDLWAALCSAKHLVSFSAADIVFRAPRSEAADKARFEELERCTSDDDLSLLACLAQIATDGWLEETIENLIHSPILARKARGLTLASLAHFDSAVFEGYINRADITGTWVADSLDTFRRYHWRDKTARHYYEQFLREADSDRSWTAFRLVIRLVDRRLNVWRKISEANIAHPKDRTKLAAISGDLKRAIERTKDYEDVLFGIKRQPGEVYPFID